MFEEKRIDNLLDFYLSINKFKNMDCGLNQSVTDHIYGSIILLTAIDSEYNVVNNLGENIRNILLETINDYSDSKKDNFYQSLINLEKGNKYLDDIKSESFSMGDTINKYLTSEGQTNFDVVSVLDEYFDKVRSKKLIDFCMRNDYSLRKFLNNYTSCEDSNYNIDELYELAKDNGYYEEWGEDEEKNKEIFRFYYLNNILKDKKRTGWDKTHWDIQTDTESIASHIVGALALALGLDSEFDFDVDIDNCLSILAIHEIGEIEIGDIAPFDGITKEEKELIEHKAMLNVLGNLTRKDEMFDSLCEFDESLSSSSKFCHYCDKLEADIQAKIYQDMGYQKDLNNQQDNVVFTFPKTKEMIKNGATTPFDIWYLYDKDIYKDSDVFTKTLDYVKSKKLK